MGTRSTVRFYREFTDRPVASIYQQYDGYVENGVGHELAEWLSGKKVINGISDERMENGYANGMGCLAAQYIADKKDRIGGFYMTTQEDAEDYNYEVRLINGKLNITVDSYGNKIFNGSPQELLNFKEYEDEEED